MIFSETLQSIFEVLCLSKLAKLTKLDNQHLLNWVHQRLARQNITMYRWQTPNVKD